MPIKVPDGLPAIDILREENITLITESAAFRQDIRPLQVAVVNIMPLKSITETQLLRLLCHSPLQVEVTFIYTSSHVSRNTHPDHLTKFYKCFEEVRQHRFDCIIITGAPVEILEFAEVKYWDELRTIMDWASSHVYSTFHLCWGAQAGLFHYYGIPKYELSQKMFGVYAHTVMVPGSPLVQGFDDVFFAPHSRHTGTKPEDILKVDCLQILAVSEVAGVYMTATKDNRQFFVSGHPENDRGTLAYEYNRDRAKGLDIAVPYGYFPSDDSTREPIMSWRSHANLLFNNWLTHVYSNTPHNLADLQPLV